MSYIGSSEIKEMYLGSTEIARAYLGSTLVFKKVAPVFYDRLVFDGTAYIDTDIRCSNGQSFNVWLGNETVKAAQRVFLMDCGQSTTLGLLYTSVTNTSYRRMGIYYASSVQGSRQYAWTNTTYNFFMTPEVKYPLWINGKQVTAVTNSNGKASLTIPALSKGTYSVQSDLFIGTSSGHSGQAYSGEMGTFYIYGSDAADVTSPSGFSSYTPVYTLRPCTYDGAAGFWCVETSKFYGNTAGSGTLSVYNL